MKKLGDIGIDKIRLSHGFAPNRPAMYPEPVIDYLTPEMGKIRRLIATGMVTIRRRSVTIFGKFWMLKWGNRNGKSYIYIEISARVNGCNLHNLSVSDVSDLLNVALADLYTSTGIAFPEIDINRITVTMCEINRTLDMSNPFHDYAFVLDLIKIGMATPLFGKWIKHDTTDKLMTYYLANKANYTIKAYDKAAELRKKGILVDDKHLMRFEIKIIKTCELTANKSHKVLFVELTDDLIEKLFLKKFQKAWKKMEKHLKEMNKEITSILLRSIMDYGINCEAGYRLFIKDVKLMAVEKKMPIPIYIDIDDLESNLCSITWMTDKQRGLIIDKLHVEADNDYCITQYNSLYRELFEKLLT